MPHRSTDTDVVVSCHVERPLDDRTWARFREIQQRRPGGFRISALIRPPHADEGEDLDIWADRARVAGEIAPLGHHSHFGGVSRARPVANLHNVPEQVEREVDLFRSAGLAPRFFVGGGWYMDEALAETLASYDYVDCSGTAFRPSYLDHGTRRLAVREPLRLTLPSGRLLLELPSTHTAGMVLRLAPRPGALRGPVIHTYFHDTDLLDWRRRAAVLVGLRLLARRYRVSDLALLAQAEATAPQADFMDVFEDAS